MTTESNRHSIGMTYREIAYVMGVSETRIRQIYNRAMKKVHAHIKRNPKLKQKIELHIRD